MKLEQYLKLNTVLGQQALIHSSYAHENGVEDNERLEFLGDSILDSVVSISLYKKHPDRDEGGLSELRAAIVNGKNLAKIAKEFGLDQYMKLGRGEKLNGGSEKINNLSGTLEAVIGSYFLENGYEDTAQMVQELIGLVAADLTRSYKTTLQNLMQNRKLGTPTYEVQSTQGPDHDRTFTVAVKFNQEEYLGTARTTKEAGNQAAKLALDTLALR